MRKISADTLWDLAADEVRARERRTGNNPDDEDDDGGDNDEGNAPCERTVFFMGSKSGGKTTILFRCIDRDQAPKPTLALEHTFGRRARAHNTDVAHLWELGGGISLSDLVQIPITPQNLSTLSVVLVLDLSKPNALWVTMENLLQAVLNQLEKAFAIIKSPGESRPSKQLSQRRGEDRRVLPKDHPDRELISPFPVPLLMIGSKFDIFQDFESEKRKVICKTLRFLAHYYGASLIFTSSKSMTTMSKLKNLFSHLAFGTDRGKYFSTDYSKPLIIPAGTDSLSQIGSVDVALGTLHAKTPLDLWKKVFESVVPQESPNERKDLKDPAKDSQYSEHLIDAMRAQKDQELEQYKREQAKSWKGLTLES